MDTTLHLKPTLYFILPLILKFVFISFLTISYQFYTGKAGWAWKL